MGKHEYGGSAQQGLDAVHEIVVGGGWGTRHSAKVEEPYHRSNSSLSRP